MDVLRLRGSFDLFPLLKEITKPYGPAMGRTQLFKLSLNFLLLQKPKQVGLEISSFSALLFPSCWPIHLMAHSMWASTLLIEQISRMERFSKRDGNKYKKVKSQPFPSIQISGKFVKLQEYKRRKSVWQVGSIQGVLSRHLCKSAFLSGHAFVWTPSCLDIQLANGLFCPAIQAPAQVHIARLANRLNHLHTSNVLQGVPRVCTILILKSTSQKGLVCTQIVTVFSTSFK